MRAVYFTNSEFTCTMPSTHVLGQDLKNAGKLDDFKCHSDTIDTLITHT